MKLVDYNSPEKKILLQYFETLPLMDKWIADLIESYIYEWVDETIGTIGGLKSHRKYRTKYGVKDGDHLYYINDHLIRKTTYKEGIKHGENIEWYSDYPPLNLPKNMHFKANYKNDLLDGEYNRWDFNNKLIEKSYYKDGKLHGKQTMWYPCGVIKSVCNYNMGNRDGEYIEYWDNRRTLIKCSYINGILDGEYNEWYSDGVLRIMYTYKMGDKIGECKDWYCDSKWFK